MHTDRRKYSTWMMSFTCRLFYEAIILNIVSDEYTGWIEREREKKRAPQLKKQCCLPPLNRLYHITICCSYKCFQIADISCHGSKLIQIKCTSLKVLEIRTILLEFVFRALNEHAHSIKYYVKRNSNSFGVNCSVYEHVSI